MWIGDGLETLIARALAHGGSTAIGAIRRGAAQSRPRRFPRLLRRQPVRPQPPLSRRARDARRVARDAGFGSAASRTNAIRSPKSCSCKRASATVSSSCSAATASPRKSRARCRSQSAAETLGVAPNAAALVGDSHQDLRAARGAGFGFVLASYGYGKIDETELGASSRIRSFAELPAALGVSCAAAPSGRTPIVRWATRRQVSRATDLRPGLCLQRLLEQRVPPVPSDALQRDPTASAFGRRVARQWPARVRGGEPARDPSHGRGRPEWNSANEPQRAHADRDPACGAARCGHVRDVRGSARRPARKWATTPRSCSEWHEASRHDATPRSHASATRPVRALVRKAGP